MMHNKKNMISGILLQSLSMISGLIIPRLMIVTLGSEVNGLVSSITYFLSLIALLEGGLGAVVLSELYKPIHDGDDIGIKEILVETQNFFIKLGITYIVFTAILSVVYPLVVDTSFSFGYVMSLVVIMSLAMLIQYVFALTSKLYLQANQEVYIVNITQAVIIVLNLVISVVVFFVYPQIHILKFVSSILFIIQPIVYKRFIDKKFAIPFRLCKKNANVLTNRWSGFSQNLAHFINLNTDVIIVTVFLGVTEVSVYSVYMLPITALRTFISLLSGNYQSALGEYYVENKTSVLKDKFKKFNRFNWQLSLIASNTCLLLINQFVQLYTEGVNDADYYQPYFALIITLAYLCFCVREPYRYMVLAAGKFKETNFGSVMEAILNMAVSIVMVFKFGLIGIAIGTFVALMYRLVYLMRYCDKNILFVRYRRNIPMAIATVLMLVINVFVYFRVKIEINGVMDFILYGFLIMASESVITFGIFKFFGMIGHKTGND